MMTESQNGFGCGNSGTQSSCSSPLPPKTKPWTRALFEGLTRALADWFADRRVEGIETSENLETSLAGNGGVSVGTWLIQMLTRNCV